MKRLLHALAALWPLPPHTGPSPRESADLPTRKIASESAHPQISESTLNNKTIFHLDRRYCNVLVYIALFMCLTARGQDAPRVLPITGTVVDTTGQAIQGATVSVIGTSMQTQTDEYGRFSLRSALGQGTLRVRFVGYQTAEVPFGEDTAGPIRIVLTPVENLIEEVEINAGYYTVSDRERTGSISRVDGKTIARQPVGNALAALHGQVPGLEVTQQTGVPGGNVVLRIRGQNSLLNGSDPLYVIDGVPFLQGQMPLNKLSNPTSETTDNPNAAGFSPLSLINPNDIASIEVLKDADATSIYGSRGANGVVLITTKSSVGEKLTLNVNFRTGLSRPNRSVEMLTGPEYLSMRREAFINDDLLPNESNAPDLMVWDTTSYIDFKKVLHPEMATYNDIQLVVSGGSDLSNYIFTTSYHDQSTVYDASVASRRLGFQSRGTLQNRNRRFRASPSLIASRTDNMLPVMDLTRYMNTSPYLRLHTEDGGLAWDNNGVPYRNLGMIDANPLARAERRYNATYWNFLGNLSLEYQISNDLTFETNGGFNLTTSDEHSRAPTSALDIYSSVRPNASFANGKVWGWVVEPQLSYTKDTQWGRIATLIGATWQDQRQSSATTFGRDYTGDALLGSITAAGNITAANDSRQYRYQGVYARVNFNHADRYFFNLTGRRDGSSRFGTENRYAVFGAIGAAWIFSSETLFDSWTALNFGKLRASYGVTGNDQIGDYRYLDLWSPSPNSYDGLPSLNVSTLFNPSFSWEKNNKLEVAIETRYINNRLRLDVNYFRNVSGNQLVQYTLPVQTGFESVTQNLPATILNEGWEISLGVNAISKPDWGLSMSFNLTRPRNKLKEFPDLENSSYRTRYVVGRSLSTGLRYEYLGVNEQTGIYEYRDVDGNGILNSADMAFPSSKDVYFFGGVTGNLFFKQFELIFTFDFKNQDGYNYLYGLGSNIPGYGYANQPRLVLRRWQNAGDTAPVQRFTSTVGEAYLSAARLASSNAIISDASFVRLRNFSLSYTIPEKLTRKFSVGDYRLSLEGQNLLTLTNYEGADPENQNIYALSPLRTVTVGISLTF